MKSLAGCEGAEDAEKTDVVFFTEKWCNIDELASCDPLKRGGDFLSCAVMKKRARPVSWPESTAAARCE